jgi:hypothetical protein
VLSSIFLASQLRRETWDLKIFSSDTGHIAAGNNNSFQINLRDKTLQHLLPAYEKTSFLPFILILDSHLIEMERGNS